MLEFFFNEVASIQSCHLMKRKSNSACIFTEQNHYSQILRNSLWLLLQHLVYGCSLKFRKFQWKILTLEFLFNKSITKPCTHLHPSIHFHPAPSTSTKLISASSQLSATPSTLLEPKY